MDDSNELINEYNKISYTKEDFINEILEINDMNGDEIVECIDNRSNGTDISLRRDTNAYIKLKEIKIDYY